MILFCGLFGVSWRKCFDAVSGMLDQMLTENALSLCL